MYMKEKEKNIVHVKGGEDGGKGEGEKSSKCSRRRWEKQMEEKHLTQDGKRVDGGEREGRSMKYK